MDGIRETDVAGEDGRVLHAYESVGDGVPVMWFHGTPNIGAPPAPLFEAAARHGLRWVSYDRPGYGPSTPNPGRAVSSAATDTASVADALGLGRFLVMGHSGGGPHALACAALLSSRVIAAVAISGPRPFADDPGESWYAGMRDPSSLRAARAGRAAYEAALATAEWDPEVFTPADHAALETDWKWVMSAVGPALDNGPGPQIDDDLAYTHDWGFDPAAITVPVLLLHGADDRMVPCSHSESLARQIPDSVLRVAPGEGHVSILRHAPEAVAWLSSNLLRTGSQSVVREHSSQATGDSSGMLRSHACRGAAAF